jgi:predicted transcriptional regulator
MPRGGFREGSLKLRHWNTGKTTTIRVPVELVPRILEVAKAMDEGRPVWVGNSDSDRLYQIKEVVLRYEALATEMPRWDKANKLISELKFLVT